MMSELDHESRELFQAGREALRPSLLDRTRIRDAIHARISGGSSVPGAELTAPGSGLGWLSFSALATAVVVGGLLFTPKARPPQAPSAASAPSAAQAPEAPPAPAALAPAPPASEAPLAAQVKKPEPRAAPKPRASDNLAQEVALLSRAEADLHAGRFGSALQILSTHQKTFPRGLLAQERVAARIQALCGLGRVKEANAELARVTPGSLHDQPTREACGPKK